jgi:hypothetical protein
MYRLEPDSRKCRYPINFNINRSGGLQCHAMGEHLGTSPSGLLPYDGDLYVFCGLTLAHGKVISEVARWGPMYPGDTNADGHVDVVDLLILVESFGKSLGDAGYSLACDLNGDGAVDLADLLIMIGDWGK